MLGIGTRYVTRCADIYSRRSKDSLVTVNRDPSLKDLRWFAGLLIPFAALMCWLLIRRGVAVPVAYGVATTGAVIGVVGLIAPQAIRWIYVGWMLAVTPIAAVVTYVLMGVVFFGVLWPIALLTKAKQRDALKLNFDKDAATYWEDKPQVTYPRRYFRQY